MGITDTGRGLIRDAVSALLTTGGIGLSSTIFSTTDTGLFGGGTTLDDCSTSTWIQGGTGGAETINSTAGEYIEGSTCLNLPATAGTASWYKAISSTDLTGTKLYMWLYNNIITDLTDSSSAVTLALANSSTFTDSNLYYTSRDNLSSGWNSIYCDVDSPDAITGSGATTSTITYLKLTVLVDVEQTTNNMRMDYWRYYEPDTLGITDSSKALTQETGNYYIKTTHSIATTESNGLQISEAGDTNGSALLSRITFATLDKGSTTELQIDKYYYIESQ